MGARVHIYTTTALGGGRVTSPTLAAYTPGESPQYSFYSRLSGSQDQSEHGVKKTLNPSDTRDRNRVVQPIIKRLAAWPTWPTHSLPEFNLFLIHAFMWVTPPGSYRATTCREWELTLNRIHNVLITQGHGGPPRMRDQLNAEAASGTKQTWKKMHNIHAHIHSIKANMKGSLWRPNDIRGPCGAKAS